MIGRFPSSTVKVKYIVLRRDDYHSIREFGRKIVASHDVHLAANDVAEVGSACDTGDIQLALVLVLLYCILLNSAYSAGKLVTLLVEILENVLQHRGNTKCLRINPITLAGAIDA